MDTIIYIVREGDTLWEIAERFGSTVNDIARYSGIANPDVLSIGQVIRIPVKITENNNNMTGETFPATYVVKPGDTLWKIAKKYGLNVSEIINLNQLTDPDMIYPNQVIILKNMR